MSTSIIVGDKQKKLNFILLNRASTKLSHKQQAVFSHIAFRLRGQLKKSVNYDITDKEVASWIGSDHRTVHRIREELFALNIGFNSKPDFIIRRRNNHIEHWIDRCAYLVVKEITGYNKMECLVESWFVYQLGRKKTTFKVSKKTICGQLGISIGSLNRALKTIIKNRTIKIDVNGSVDEKGIIHKGGKYAKLVVYDVEGKIEIKETKMKPTPDQDPIDHGIASKGFKFDPVRQEELMRAYIQKEKLREVQEHGERYKNARRGE